MQGETQGLECRAAAFVPCSAHGVGLVQGFNPKTLVSNASSRSQCPVSPPQRVHAAHLAGGAKVSRGIGSGSFCVEVSGDFMFDWWKQYSENIAALDHGPQSAHAAYVLQKVSCMGSINALGIRVLGLRYHVLFGVLRPSFFLQVGFRRWALVLSVRHAA